MTGIEEVCRADQSRAHARDGAVIIACRALIGSVVILLNQLYTLKLAETSRTSLSESPVA